MRISTIDKRVKNIACNFKTNTHNNKILFVINNILGKTYNIFNILGGNYAQSGVMYFGLVLILKSQSNLAYHKADRK